MSTIFQDIRYAARSFAKNPGFTAVVVISIGLGIAANTTVFSLVNGLLLGQLPVREPDRLVVFSGGRSLPYPDYLDYQEQTKGVFEGVAAHFPVIPASIGGRGEPERVWGQAVTANYFSVSGADLALGRGFLPEEDKGLGANPVIVLSNGVWRRRFAADPSITGKAVVLNGASYTVVGVARPGFLGTDRALVPEFWVPLSMVEKLMPDLAKEHLREARNSQWLILTARLKPGVSREQAAAAVNVVKRRIDDTYHKGDERKKAPITLGAAGGLLGEVNQFAVGLMTFLMVIVGLVLMIACANVANLLLARAASRRREIGIRLAIGAGRGRLIRQLLTESVFLAMMGAVAAWVLTWLAAGALTKFQLPLPVPIVFDFMPDARVFAFTGALALITGLIFGLAPAIRATRPDIVATLKEGGAGLGRLRRFGMRNMLVVVQVSLSMVLLVGAGLFLRSLQTASSVDLGFRSDGVMLMAVDPKSNGYSAERTKQFLSQLRERAAAQPGVASVSFLDSLPLSFGGASFDFRIAGEKNAKPVETDVYRVGAHYFETVGMHVVRGRDFEARPDDVRSIIINQTMARKLFGSQDPLGRQIYADEKAPYQIVGIAADAKSRTIGEEPQSCAYYSLESAPDEVMSFFGISLIVRTSGNPGAMFHTLRDQILALDPNLAVFNAETMQDHVNKALLIPKISATLLGVFGVIGLTLATVGLYGVMSYVVRSRTREIGIRMALGAEAGRVLRLIARQGLVMAGVGLTVGLAAALALSRFAAAFLYGIQPNDLMTFAGVSLVLLAVALVAVLVPARRAAKVDPIQALHYE